MTQHQQTTASSDGTSGRGGSTTLKIRAYQREMLEESLRRNIIVAMDTGSGKTQIAVLRIREELGRCPPEKLVWFLTPTVALAEQQHAVISQQLPAFQTRLLSGMDNVDHWSNQEIWDSILRNIRIVVSTPQVLLDAMSRGFVKLNRIALLVFDEAHSCVASHPTNMIMRNFYHPLRRSGNTSELPSVLGLTASPVTKANVGGLRTIEENLNAICRTPTVHREELLQYVHQPEITRITYERNEYQPSPLLRSLEILVDKALYDVENDPQVKRLRMRNDLKSQEELNKILFSGKTTPCGKELKGFVTRARVIHEELGPWAADAFIDTCVRRFRASAFGASEDDMLVDWQTDEKKYVADVLSQLPITETKLWRSVSDPLSQKSSFLIELLAKTYTPDLRAIIFAQQRATVVMLAHLLSVHPLMTDIIPGHFVGTSSYAGRKSSLFEISHPRDQKGAIDDLRTGNKNVLVATSVLEEGIDVSACNLVICYDPPSNLRSFIQRRGRARKEKSKLIMFFEKNNTNTETKWIRMEEIMKEIYSDSTRMLAEIEERENAKEDGEEVFRIESTKALLTYENARPYLDHFCSTIVCAYTETRPDFIIIRFDEQNLLRAKVILPSVLDPSLREISGKGSWKTERMAKRDAAFQAYLALYKAGLVNDNLMPKHCEGRSDTAEPIEKRQNLVRISARFNPWIGIAKMWKENLPLYQTKIKFSPQTFGLPRMVVLMPVALPCRLCFKLFWNEETTVAVSLKPNKSSLISTSIETAKDVAYLLLSSVFSGRMPTNRTDFPVLFLPELSSTLSSLKTWLASVKGRVMAQELAEIHDPDTFPQLGLVRTIGECTRPFMIESISWMVPIDEKKADKENEEEPTAGSEEQEQQRELHLQGTTLPKRTDFLHPVAGDAKGSLHHTAKQCIVARSCSIDRLPAMYARFALLIPSVIHKIEILLVAEKLARTILAPVGFDDLTLVMTAISASVAREETNYQRLEFLGDSVLKFRASLHLLAMNPLWHEGLLSFSKDRIVSNGRLSRAALDLGLDAYILTEAFTGLKWRPSYISDLLESESNSSSTNRELSTKVLADVVEALVGASYVDGGMEKTLRCLKVFLPEVEWKTVAEEVNQLYDAVPAPDDRTPLAILPEIETLIGYTFTKKVLLVESLTHPSTQDRTVSYQRLEFLGDSILDHMVVRELFFHNRHSAGRELPHYDMHLMRTALVNKDFLAFLCMDSISMDKTREEPTEQGLAHISTIKKTAKVHLWQYMRHSASWDIVTAQHAAHGRYEELRDAIRDALHHSRKYPWALLTRLEAGKFFSDLVESLLGAIFVDSRGSLDECRSFLERIGLMAYMRRILNEKIVLYHPKERLGLVAQSKRVQYDTKAKVVPLTTTSATDNNSVSAAEGEGTVTCRWVCSVRVGEEDIVQIDDGVSAFEAETRAADAAVEILIKRGNNSSNNNNDNTTAVKEKEQDEKIIDGQTDRLTD